MDHDLRIFVVDDRPMIAYTLSAVLRDQGCSVIPYTDPLRALRDARRFTPDVLISDVEMPALGGVDLAIQVQAQCLGRKVILMSAHLGPINSLERARDHEFEFPLFAKPVSASTIVEELEGISGAQS